MENRKYINWSCLTWRAEQKRQISPLTWHHFVRHGFAMLVCSLLTSHRPPSHLFVPRISIFNAIIWWCLFCLRFYFILSKWCSQICCSFIMTIALIFIPCNLHKCSKIRLTWSQVEVSRHDKAYKHTYIHSKTQNYQRCLSQNLRKWLTKWTRESNFQSNSNSSNTWQNFNWRSSHNGLHRALQIWAKLKLFLVLSLIQWIYFKCKIVYIKLLNLFVVVSRGAILMLSKCTI